MKGFNQTCRGASHVKSSKVCQDYSLCEVTPEMSIALISDGHGGERYYRSHIGSKFACDVSIELARDLVRQLPSGFLAGVPLTQYGTKGVCCGLPSKKHFDVFRQFGNSIIANWRRKVVAHAIATPLSETEKAIISEKYHGDLADEERAVKVYGCTLIGYVQTPTYWFGFQIGDGKCFSFHSETEPKMPILWDENCFLNKTTSLCDSNASEEMRYTFQGDGNFPFAVFMGSDGIDDSFGDDKNLINFYVEVLKQIYKSGPEVVMSELASDLPVLSQKGSQDDMSVAVVYNEQEKRKANRIITEWQLNIVKADLSRNSERIRKFEEERESLENLKKTNPKAAIDYDYAVKEIAAAKDKEEQLKKRCIILEKEVEENGQEVTGALQESRVSQQKEMSLKLSTDQKIFVGKNKLAIKKYNRHSAHRSKNNCKKRH